MTTFLLLLIAAIAAFLDVACGLANISTGRLRLLSLAVGLIAVALLLPVAEAAGIG